MYSDQNTHRWVGFPIRISMDQRLLAAPHGFSQRATSFIASWCQGIHRTPFSCSQPRGCQIRIQHPHLAQEPSNPSLDVSDLSLPICRPIPTGCENNRPGRDGRAIKHIHSLHASEHLPVAGTWVARATLLRSDLQPARPDAPNPDSHVKRTNPALRRRLGHTRDHRSDHPVRAPLNARTISFSLRDDRLSKWRWTVSNRRPPACKAGALPLSYTPRRHNQNESFCFFFQKEALFFLERKNQRTFIR